MKLKKIHFTDLLFAGIVLVGIISLSSTFFSTQSLLRYSDLKDAITLTLSAETENAQSLLDKLSTLPNVSKINRDDKTVYFQNTLDINYVFENEELKELSSQAVIGKIITVNSDTLVNTIFLVLVITATFITFVFFYVIRLSSLFTWGLTYSIFRIYFASLFYIIILSGSLLSILSNIYSIKIIEIILFLVPVIFFNLIFLHSVNRLKFSVEVSKELILGQITKTYFKSFSRIYKIFVPVIVVIAFALGVNFVITAGIFLGSLYFALKSPELVLQSFALLKNSVDYVKTISEKRGKSNMPVKTSTAKILVNKNQPKKKKSKAKKTSKRKKQVKR